MLGGVVDKPIYIMFNLSAKHYTSRISLINLGEVVSLILLEWNGW